MLLYSVVTVLKFLMTFEPQCQAWRPLVVLELPWKRLRRDDFEPNQADLALILWSLGRLSMQRFRGSALDSADLGPAPALCLLVMSLWARRLHSPGESGISFLIFEVGTIIPRFLPGCVQILLVTVSNTNWYTGSTTFHQRSYVMY